MYVIEIGVFVYIVISMIHLLFSFKENSKLQSLTKPLIMLSLLTMVIVYSTIMNSKNIILIMAVLCGLLGDVLLMFKRRLSLFAAGGVSFFVGHLLYITQMIKLFSFKVGWYIYLVIFILMLIWTYIVEPKLKKNMNKLAVCASLYAFILLLGFSVSIVLFVATKNKSAILLIFGFLLFIISDTILVYSAFFKPLKKAHFYLMIPYVIAQACLACGILLF